MTFKTDEGVKKGKYSDVISMLVNLPVQGGLTLLDNRHRLAILDACDKADLTKADGTYLKKMVTAPNFKIPFMHKDFEPLM